MRNNLIRYLFLFLLCVFELFASTYKWSVETNKKTVFVNEAIHLKYSCEFSDRGELYVIDFNPVTQNEQYTVTLLTENTQIKDGRRINNYEYIVYIHKAGEMLLEFDALMKKTNQDSIENTVIGRDNGEYEEYSYTTMKHERIIIDVKETNASLVGTLDLEVKSDKKELKAYEPYNVEIILNGLANFDELKPIEFSIDGVKVFSQKPIQNTTLTEDGYKGQWRQKFAFVAKEDFSIPNFSIEYFDLLPQKKKQLKIEQLNVSVTPAYVKEKLLDEEDDEYSFSYDFIYYILTFLAGFLTAKIRFKKEKVLNSKEAIFQEKIQKAKSLDELVFMLVLENQNKYQELISKIEKKELTSLKEVKRLIAN